MPVMPDTLEAPAIASQSNGETGLDVMPVGYGEAEKRDTDWVAVRNAAIAGVEYPALSQIFKVPEGTIRSRSSRENWPVTFKLGPKNRPATEKQQKDSNETALQVVKLSLAQIGEQHPLKVAQYASAKLSEAIAGDLLPVPTTWKDANTVDTIVRRAIGLDKASVNVQIGAWSAPGAAGWEDECVTVEAESKTIPDDEQE